MNIVKPCKAIAGGAVLSLALVHAPAKAAVDFQSNSLTTLPAGGTIISGDYTFFSTSAIGIVNGNTSPFGVSNGTNMLVFSNQGVLTVTRSDNGLFALGGLDAGGWLNLPTPNPAQLSFTGHLQGGGKVSLFAPSPPGLPTLSFAHVTTSPLSTNLTSLTMTMTGYGSSAYAAIDNLLLSAPVPVPVPVPVPEPETYALFLAGLGLVGVIARRRRAS